MNEPIPEPLRGADIIAWAGPVTRALNSLPDKVGATFRNERDRRGASSPDMGCWKIVGGTREEEPVRLFGNQYYAAREVLHQTELDDAVEDFVCQGELGEDEEYTEDDLPYVALKIPATAGSTEEPQLVGYKTFRELVAEQKDPAYVIRALYKFWHDGSVAIDFRNCQMIQVAEFVAGGDDDEGDVEDDGENSGATGEYDGGEEVQT